MRYQINQIFISMKKFLTLFIGLIWAISLQAQDSLNRAITTAVPFLSITPSARAGALGETGVATSPDATSLHFNVAKLAFAQNKMSFELSYTPWLKAIANDINLSYLGGYYKPNDLHAFTFGLTYFSIGEIIFTNDIGEEYTAYKPTEFAISGGYAMKLSDYLSGGVALKFIYSNLTGGISASGIETHPGIAFAGDISFFYDRQISDKYHLNLGISARNLGSKISYSAGTEPSFIPSELKLGTNNTFTFDEYNTLSISLDASKLLVPSPPVYDGLGVGPDHIVKGKDPNVSVPMGIIQSFYDAPYGFSEEWHEINWGFGAEYWYAGKFALRAGYFYEHPTKGGRIYYTTGIGLKLNIYKIDFSYIIPTNKTGGYRSPLASTMRFTLGFDFK